MNEHYNELDRNYANIKNDIEMSKSPEEQEYWTRRGNEVWEQRDKLGGEIDDYIRKHKK